MINYNLVENGVLRVVQIPLRSRLVITVILQESFFEMKPHSFQLKIRNGGMEGKQTALLIFSAVLIDCFQTGVTLRFVVDCSAKPPGWRMNFTRKMEKQT